MRINSTLAFVLFAIAAPLAACGGDDAPAVDGAPGDPDADPTPDAEVAGRVTVAVFEAGTTNELDGVPVLFFDRDGELVDEVETDNDGEASADLFTGSSAVVIYPGNPLGVVGGDPPTAVLLSAVVAGQRIEVGGYEQPEPEDPFVATANDNDDETNYVLAWGCPGGNASSESAATPSWADVDVTCDEPTMVVLTSTDDIALATGDAGTVEIDDPLELDVDYQDTEAADWDLVNIPDAVGGSFSPFGQVPGIRLVPALALAKNPYEPGDEEIRMDAVTPAIAGYRQGFFIQLATADSTMLVADVRPPTDEVDFEEVTVADCDDVDIDDDASRLSWDQDEGTVNFVLGGLSVTRGEVVANWYFAGVPSDAGVTFPVLPGDYEDYNFEDADELAAQVYVMNLRGSSAETVAASPFGLFAGGLASIIPEDTGSFALRLVATDK